jgi:cytochrome c biogenesis protein CcmG, thiol:disulfide interchange protein DsbE
VRFVFVSLCYLLGGQIVHAAPKVGELAPPFKLQTIEGATIESGDLKGKVIVINLWATWCGPCRRELPLLSGFHQILESKGLRIYPVLTHDNVSKKSIKAFAGDLRMPLIWRMKGKYPVIKGLPTNYVIDRAGVVRYAKAAALDLNDLNRLLVPLLNEPVPESVPPAQTTAPSAAATMP